jgi:methenyltetrahydrofolate cyclohydrolase
MPVSPSDRLLADLLVELSDGRIRGASGYASALSGALAAGLAVMVAKHGGDGWADAPGVAAQAGTLRERLLQLAREDSLAFAAAEQLLGQASEAEEPVSEARDHALADAVRAAAAVPMRIAETAADVVTLAAWAAENVSPEVRVDALAAVRLAEASANTAASLVDVNLVVRSEDELATRARAAAATARQRRASACAEE